MPQKSEAKVDNSLAPEDFFFVPGRDEGLSLLAEPKWYWRYVPKANICAFSISDYPDHNALTDQVIADAMTVRNFTQGLEFNRVPAIAHDVRFVKNVVGIGGKWLLSGAAGERLRNRYTWHGAGRTQEESVVETNTFLSDLKSDPTVSPIPVKNEELGDRPFVIEARNLFNYYHFLIETLPRLQIAVDLKHRGPIYICYKGQKPASFARAYVDALFPEIAAQVEFLETPQEFENAIIDFAFDHYYFTAKNEIIPPAVEAMPRGQGHLLKNTSRHAYRIFRHNSYMADLRSLRERALAAISRIDTSHLPRKFWVQRNPLSERSRDMLNEDLLIAELQKQGFVALRFEDYSPLEQIALMANAEVMASHHGAAFANMMFASADAYVIEIGTVQTALGRWGDFFAAAHVARTNYVTFFADHNWDTPDQVPNFDDHGHIGVALGTDGIKRVSKFTGALVGAVPKSLTKPEVEALAEMLTKANATNALQTMLNQYSEFVNESIPLLQARATILDAKDDVHGLFDTLTRIRRIAPGRPRPLERMIWLTRRMGRRDLSDVLVAEHAQRFPRRHAEFRKKISWYKDG